MNVSTDYNVSYTTTASIDLNTDNSKEANNSAPESIQQENTLPQQESRINILA